MSYSSILSSRRTVVAAILAITVLSGVVHGYLDGRWSGAKADGGSYDRLNQLPEQIGDWKLVDRQELSANAEDLLRCYGSVIRLYQHSETGLMVNFAIMHGPRGPIAVHTPEVCYSSEGTEQSRQRIAKTFRTKDRLHELWSVEFTRDGQSDASMEVVYGWSDGGTFVAAENPRFWLTDDLYKLQLAGPVGTATFDPCQSFLDALLPHLEKLVE